MQGSDNERLKKVRMHLKKSQSEFGKPLGVTQGAYSQIERGSKGIPYGLLKKLNFTYKVNSNYILFGNSPMFLNHLDHENIEFSESEKDQELKQNDNNIGIDSDTITLESFNMPSDQPHDTALLRQEIQFLREKVELLETSNQDLRGIIDLLRRGLENELDPPEQYPKTGTS